jgi:hypothetical protein
MTIEQKPELKKAKTEGKDATELAHTIRDGAIAASVWKRQSQTGFPYFEFSLSRSYASISSGKKGYRSNFFARNKEQLVKVVSEACDWCAQHEQENFSDKLAA